MADQRRWLTGGMKRGQRLAERRAGQQILHRRMATRNVNRVKLAVTPLRGSRQADHRRRRRRRQFQFVEQRAMHAPRVHVIVEIHFVIRGFIERRRLPVRRGERDLVPGVQQTFYRLHQFIEIKASLKHFAVFQIQMVRIRQHYQHAGGMRTQGRKTKRCGEREMTYHFHHVLLLMCLDLQALPATGAHCSVSL
ncbi:hypothetical protein BN128_1526 [Cronobacter sakazakii 696]|nr:hypothetical protein BN128_1526 [Cronobacter sakazakii 696]